MYTKKVHLSKIPRILFNFIVGAFLLLKNGLEYVRDGFDVLKNISQAHRTDSLDPRLPNKPSLFMLLENHFIVRIICDND